MDRGVLGPVEAGGGTRHARAPRQRHVGQTARRHPGRTDPIDILAAPAPTHAQAARTASLMAFVLLGGTLLPIDRVTTDRPPARGSRRNAR